MPVPSTTTSAFSSDIEFPNTVTGGFHIMGRPPMPGFDGKDSATARTGASGVLARTER
jgi:hypothetical protein